MAAPHAPAERFFRVPALADFSCGFFFADDSVGTAGVGTILRGISDFGRYTHVQQIFADTFSG